MTKREAEQREHTRRALEAHGISAEDFDKLRRISLTLRRWQCERREGALRRLKSIIETYPTLTAYVQGDPRGAALYILRPGDIPPGESEDVFYTRGICIF